jgi:Domain of unknown function (DUF4345)
MKTFQFIRLASSGFILLSCLALSAVSIMAFMNPQSVMDLVKVRLGNTDAISSIRGIYGGVGLTIVLSLLYLLLNNRRQALVFLCMLWGFYAISRLITIGVEGQLGTFGMQWLWVESVFCGISIGLWWAERLIKVNIL